MHGGEHILAGKFHVGNRLHLCGSQYALDLLDQRVDFLLGGVTAGAQVFVDLPERQKVTGLFGGDGVAGPVEFEDADQDLIHERHRRVARVVLGGGTRLGGPARRAAGGQSQGEDGQKDEGCFFHWFSVDKSQYSWSADFSPLCIAD